MNASYNMKPGLANALPDMVSDCHFERPRLSALLAQAVKYPLVVVCAGAGYGKTSAILDFARGYDGVIAWVQMTERDNVGSRFWENYTHTIMQLNQPFAKAIHALGFPDTDDKIRQYYRMIRENVEAKKRILVFDDFHLIEDPAVLRFVEQGVREMQDGTSVILVSRTMPRINAAGLDTKGRLVSITENDLRFTEHEIARYLHDMMIPVKPASLRMILRDTDGWAFAVNLIARSFRRAPGYEGYLRNAMKANVFQFMEMEIWSEISESLQTFLIRLSLIDHLAVDLLLLLAKGDGELIKELDRQNAYIRRDDYIDAYLIHHLFLEFLRSKQDLLTETQIRETYAVAAEWCDKNGFRMDAMSYYEKIGDYTSIVSIFLTLPPQASQDVARFALGIFQRTPESEFTQVDFLAMMHVRVVMRLGLWEEAAALVKRYEECFLRLAQQSPQRWQLLGEIYYSWGVLRMFMAASDDAYDFDVYYAKMDECLSQACAVISWPLAYYTDGPWINLAGSSRQGAPEAFIRSLACAAQHAFRCINGAMEGLEDLAEGELKYYQGDVGAAETHIIRGMEKAKESGQPETIHKALFFILQIGVYQGNREKAEQALREMKDLLDENEYSSRYLTYDIAQAWYYCFLEQPENVPDWLKEKFAPYGHAYYIEYYGNQAKAFYRYRTKSYPALLAYFEEQKQRGSVLFGRIEMLAMEACVYYKKKDRTAAFEALKNAYEEASPNGIVLPFVRLGKDMRSLTAAALKMPDCGIPAPWLNDVNRKSATYAKRQSHVIAEYKKANRMGESVTFSQREEEILTDLSHGLSRKEIAASRNLSVNTVKMIISAVYTKLGAENLADMIRITTEQRLL